MKYLILGSSGKIGSILTKYLKNIGHDVFTWDIKSSLQEDLRIKNCLDNIIHQVDFVFFLAYDVGGSLYLQNNQNKFEFIDNNINIMTNVFNTLKKYNTPFIFTSSEMASLNFSTYGILKSIGDCYVKSLNGIVTKLWNVYTPDITFSEKSHVINDFIHMAKTNKKIVLKTNGNEERQLLYVDDCCECLYTLSKNYDTFDRNEEIHIAKFEWISILNVAKLISELFDNIPVITSNPSDTTHKNIKTEPNPYILNFWNPKTSLKTGILNIINYDTSILE